MLLQLTVYWLTSPMMLAGRATCALLMSLSRTVMSSATEGAPPCPHRNHLLCLELPLKPQCPALGSACPALQAPHPADTRNARCKMLLNHRTPCAPEVLPKSSALET